MNEQVCRQYRMMKCGLDNQDCGYALDSGPTCEDCPVNNRMKNSVMTAQTTNDRIKASFQPKTQ